MSPFSAMRRLRRDTLLSPGLRGALVAGVVLHIAGIALIGATWRLPAPPPEEPSFVRLSDARETKRAEVMDPAPLFLPTLWNHGAGSMKTVRGAPARPGDPDDPPLAEPRLDKPDKAVPPLRPSPVARILQPGFPPARIAEVASPRTDDLFLTKGRIPADTATLAPAGPRYRLTDATTGRIVATGALTLPGTVATGAPVRPAVFAVEVSGYGISPPIAENVVMDGRNGPGAERGTGDAATDDRLAKAVAEALLKTPPPPGRYRVEATP